MPDNKHSPKGELFEDANIDVYKFNVVCTKTDELQFLNILSANKVPILCSVHILYQVCYIVLLELIW
jgi:hypothetical protein